MISIARTEQLLIQEVGNELIIYDQINHSSHCLNAIAARVWELCNGRHTVDDIARVLEKEFGRAFDEDVDLRGLIWLTLEELEQYSLIEGDAKQPKEVFGLPRRTVLKTAVLAGGFAVGSMFPAVRAMVTPEPVIRLNNKEIDFFNQYGFVGPFTAFTREEMEFTYRKILKSINKLKLFNDKKYRLYTKRNRHLDWTLITQLCCHSTIVERVANLLGPDLILWRSNLFFALQGMGLPWHQDEYNTLLSNTDNHISVHLAISTATPENCLSIIPGTHKLSQEELHSHYGLQMIKDSNHRGYGVPFYKLKAENQKNDYKMLLNPGQFFIFHPRLIHKSESNSLPGSQQIVNKANWFLAACSSIIGQLPASEWLRVALGIRITVPSVKVFPSAFVQTQQRNDRCILLRGRDEFGLNGDI